MTKTNLLKKTLAITLALMLTVGAGLCGYELPVIGSVSANAAEEEIIWTDATEAFLEFEGDAVTAVKKDVSLPANLRFPEKTSEGVAITTIKASVFMGRNDIEAVMIPETITKIGARAFENCTNLKKVYFNSNNAEIVNAIFKNCTALTEVVFGENVTAIPESVCSQASSLVNVVFEGKVTSIGNYAFFNCKSLTDIDLSDVVFIGNSAFNNCDSLTTVAFSDNLIEIGSQAFVGCDGLTAVTIPETVKTIRAQAFMNCANLENVYFNCINAEIINYIFTDCVKLDKIVFGKNVTVIPESVCGNAESLKTVVFDGKITSVGSKAFYNCPSLSDVYFAGTEAEWKAVTIKSNNEALADATIHYLTSTNDNTVEIPVEKAEISIRNNKGTKTIDYGDTLRLTATVTNMPADAKIFWYVNGVKQGEGVTFDVSPERGSIEITVKLVDENGNNYAGDDISDSQTVTVNASLLRIILSFFKNLFRFNRTVIQSINGIF